MRDLGTAQLPAWPLAVGDRIDRSQLDRETVVATSPDAYHGELGGNLFVLHRLDRVCFSLSPLAARLWKAMSRPHTLGELVRAASENDAPLSLNDVAAWIETMMSYGLVEVGPSAAAGSRKVDIEELRRLAYSQRLAVA